MEEGGKQVVHRESQKEAEIVSANSKTEYIISFAKIGQVWQVTTHLLSA